MSVGSIVKQLIDEGKGHAVNVTLLKLGVTPCVAREWAGEKVRRLVLARRRHVRAWRKGRMK